MLRISEVSKRFTILLNYNNQIKCMQTETGTFTVLYFYSYAIVYCFGCIERQIGNAERCVIDSGRRWNDAAKSQPLCFMLIQFENHFTLPTFQPTNHLPRHILTLYGILRSINGAANKIWWKCHWKYVCI